MLVDGKLTAITDHSRRWAATICTVRTARDLVSLILRKFILIVAIKCHILRLKCVKFDFGWGSASDPAVGAELTYSSLAGLKGPYF